MTQGHHRRTRVHGAYERVKGKIDSVEERSSTQDTRTRCFCISIVYCVTQEPRESAT